MLPGNLHNQLVFDVLLKLILFGFKALNLFAELSQLQFSFCVECILRFVEIQEAFLYVLSPPLLRFGLSISMELQQLKGIVVLQCFTFCALEEVSGCFFCRFHSVLDVLHDIFALGP